MCEATRQLQRLRYELSIQRGNGVIDLGKLDRMMAVECEDHGERT
jgi:hypothetical protein